MQFQLLKKNVEAYILLDVSLAESNARNVQEL